MSEINITDVEIAKLQDIAHNILNFTLNHSPLLKLPPFRRYGDGKVYGKIISGLKDAFKLIKNNEFLLKHFNLFCKNLETKDINGSLLNFFHGLFNLTKWYKEQPDMVHEQISLFDIPTFQTSRLRFNNPENVCLENISTIFNTNKDLFEIAFINGSLGSNDYVPGWSDVDIFAVLSSAAVNSNDNFCRIKSVARKIKKEIFSYNRIQVHPVFYSLESDLLFHRHIYFPTVCLKRGKLLVSKSNTLFLCGSEFIQKRDASKVYIDLYYEFKQLKARKNKSPLAKVHLLHRVFVFPFRYLAIKGITCYKADSFDLLPRYFKKEPNILTFCKSLKEIYRGMTIQCSHAYRLRRFFMNVLNPKFVNNLSLRLGSKQTASIERLFDSIDKKGLFEETERYWSLGMAELKEKGSVI